MTNTELIYSGLATTSVDKVDIDTVDIETDCMMCGKPITKGAPYKKVVSGNFTDWDICKNLDSQHICRECATVIKTRELRTHNFIASKGSLILFKKSDIEKYLFNLDEYLVGEFVIGITRSFKKHSSFKCPVNRSTGKFFIQEEDKTYLFNARESEALYKSLWDAYLYFTKDEILTGNYKMIGIQEFGIQRYMEYEQLFKKHRGSHYFDLLVYMLDSGRRNEIVDARLKEQKAKAEEEKKRKREEEKLEKLAEQEIPGQLSLF